MAFATVLALLILMAVLARWVILSTRGDDGHSLAARDAQMARLREEVDALQSEVRRLGEEQSFMVRLLTEGDRPRTAPPPGSGPDLSNPETT
ncbi:MAG TPA: hypothetical protein VFQ45_21990 [Longimicrobium sp.]|nr:hypothetical protein [Longimicrobium sp.]